ncbi:hypothetical protein HPG69_008838, partial [Diceros bicornis minor]
MPALEEAYTVDTDSIFMVTVAVTIRDLSYISLDGDPGCHRAHSAPPHHWDHLFSQGKKRLENEEKEIACKELGKEHVKTRKNTTSK